MDLESITKAIDEVVANIPVTIQINKLTSSHLSVVFNRQKDYPIEYTDLYEKVLETLKSFEMGEIKSIKFFGRESDGDYEWQYDFIVNANSQNVLPSSSTKTSKDKKVNKALVIGSVVVLILTGVGGFLYFNNFQYQQAKQSAKQAINQDFIKCENAKLGTENNTTDTSVSPEIQKLTNQSIEITKKATEAKIKNSQDSSKILEEFKSLEDKTNNAAKQLDIQIEEALSTEKLAATQRLAELAKLRLSGVKLESEVRLEETLLQKKAIELELNLEQQKQSQLAKLAEIKKNAETNKVKGINKLKKELLDIENAQSKQIDNINRQIAERQLIEKTKADELKKQKMEDDKKSCQIVDDYKRKYER